MLKNAYLGAKIGFDTAANELSKVGCAASYQLYLYLLSGTQATFAHAFEKDVHHHRQRLDQPREWRIGETVNKFLVREDKQDRDHVQDQDEQNGRPDERLHAVEERHQHHSQLLEDPEETGHSCEARDAEEAE